MQPIAIDAMGGDKAPGEIIAGARAAAAEGIPVVLVGPTGLDGIGDLPLIEANEVIGMTDDPASSVRRKKDSTLVRAAEAVRDGRASAMISAGNTGATMASALLRMGRIKGVSRPAVATPIPVPGTTPTVLLDAGANAEVQPEWLVQFAQMGSVYTATRFGIETPRVGLLSIGEEPGKGDTLRKDAYRLLTTAPGIDFIGNIEGRDIMTDGVDVAVTDGFTGNVVLKTLEGGVKSVISALLAAFADPAVKEHADALLPALLPLYATLDPDTYGGAMLLGVDGVCIISHGSTGERAMLNAVKVAKEMVEQDLVAAIRDVIGAAARRSHDRLTAGDSVRPVPAETHVEQGPIDRSEIFEIVRDRLADILEIEPSTISEGQSFVDDLDADSLALIELVEALEEELSERTVGFRIDDEDLADLKTVRDAVDYVHERTRLTATPSEADGRGRRGAGRARRPPVRRHRAAGPGDGPPLVVRRAPGHHQQRTARVPR